MHLTGYSLVILALVATISFSKAQEPEIEGVDTTVDRYGQTYSIQCKVTNVDSYGTMQWYFDGEKLAEDPEKYIMDSKNGTLTIKEVMPVDVGEYKCMITLGNGNSFNQTVNIYSIPYVHSFDTSKNLVQGDPLVLECDAVGNPDPIISWLKDGESLDYSDERLTLTDKNELINATLRLENLQFEDRAEYTCVATNAYGSSNSTILVRVKDKLAALWPFLGICAEVAILVIIIFVYEHRRSKKLEELDAREEADHLTNSHAHKGGDEVRQRK